MKKVLIFFFIIFFVGCNQSGSDNIDSETIKLTLRTNLQGTSLAGTITAWVYSDFYKDGVLLVPHVISKSGTNFNEIAESIYYLPRDYYTLTVVGHYGNSVNGDTNYSDINQYIIPDNDYYLYSVYYSGASISCFFIY